MTAPANSAMGGCDPQVVAEFLRALAHPMRLTILCRLLEGEVSVAGFENELGLRQPSLSQQLGQLREAGLVVARREAKSMFYSLADGRVRAVLGTLHTAFAFPGTFHKENARTGVAKPTHAGAAPIDPTDKPSTRAGAQEPIECGVFAVAGWPTP